MNEIEKDIAGLLNDKKRGKRASKHSYKKNKRKKILLIIIIVILGIIFSLYLILENHKKPNITEKPKQELPEETSSLSNENIGYVDCDTNTSLLNVRSRPEESIIDGLSCFQEVTIEEELEKTANCPKWYKITYYKHQNHYTGYACSTYIEKTNTPESLRNTIKDVIDKAINYYDESIFKAYCGTTNEENIKKIEFTNNGNKVIGEYLKSEYHNLEELKKYLLSFFDESLINDKIKLSDYHNPRYFDNYYEIDGSLYCRNYSGKDYHTTYTGNYNFEITNINNNKIDVRISYEYLNKEDETCHFDDLSKCLTSHFVYTLGDIKIVKEGENYIITAIDFHD